MTRADTTPRRVGKLTQSEDQLRAHARQQAALAKLSQRALAGVDLSALMEEAVTLVAQTLEVEFCRVFELHPDGKALLSRAGVGRKKKCAGRLKIGAKPDSEVGYALLTGEPVIVNDLRTETRFRVPPRLNDYGAVSGMTVIIAGRDRPFGVLGARTTRRRRFGESDVHFLQTVADLLAEAVERQRSEGALRRNEEHFRALVECASDIITVLDAHGTVRYQSPSATRVLGYEPAYFIGKNISKFIHPDDLTNVVNGLALSIQDPTAGASVEYRVRHRDGSWRYLESVDMVFGNDSGVPLLVINSRDVTERRRAVEALRESEERYRLLTEKASDVIWTTDMNLRFTYMSPSVARIRGYSVDEIMAQKMEDALTPASRQVAMKALAEELDMEKLEPKDPFRTRTVELEEFCKDGSTVWVEVKMTFLRDPDGKPVGILGVTRDISERKGAEEALRESKERIRLVGEPALERITAHDNGEPRATTAFVGPLSGHAASLTPRQKEVLEHIVAGRTNEEIAKRLVVSRRTVERHVEAILDKFDVENRAAAAAIAVAAGLARVKTTPA